MKAIKQMTEQTILKHAQRFFDQDNWKGLNSDERQKFNELKHQYQIKTGKPISLTYNCPA